jgi:acetolactate synthase-1/3 small subunit
MTIKTTGSDEMVEQITKHLNRLIDVVKVVNLTDSEFVERELVLVKVRATGKNREEFKRMADIFRGNIVDVTDKTYTIELTGDEDKFLAFLSSIDEEFVIEVARTGSSGLARGEKSLSL